MTIKHLIMSAAAAVGCFATASGADFFDTSRAESVFNLGLRVGVNTSNRTLKANTFNAYQHNSWGTGFEAGVVANLNFREWLAIQPGFFYQCRSGDFTYINVTDPVSLSKETQFGHWRRYVANIPIMVSVRFNLSDDVRWQVEAGPYFQFGLAHSEDPFYLGPAGDRVKGKAKGSDAGIKVGTGLRILGHYFVGVHYLAGMSDVWENNLGGHSKCWSFTVGYDF